MKTLSRRTKFFLCATSSTHPYPNFLRSLILSFHSSNNQEPQKKKGGTSQLSFSSSSYSLRHHDEESRNVNVLVWWDFESCSIPSGVNAFRVAQRITSSLRDIGINGPVTITAFGDVLQLSRSNQEALSSTGICINHVPQGGKNCADRSLLVHLMFWVYKNPPPAHLFLISGDRDFTNILHRLRMNNYNILLASSESAPDTLCSAASIMWPWNSLVRGDSHGGKIYNQPPDGPYGSWYGHYKGPLEDPFLDTGQPASVQAEESPVHGADSKVRPIPKALVNRICQIVNSYPKGINVTELLSELRRSNVAMDKDFFGHKKFARLLASLPSVFKLQSASDGQILVQSTQPKTAEPVGSNLRLSTGSSSSNRKEEPPVVTEFNGRNNAITANVYQKVPFSAASPPKQEHSPLGPKEIAACPTGGHTTPVEQDNSILVSPPKEEPTPLGMKEIAACSTGGHSTSLEQDNSMSEVGFFQRIWGNWFRHKSSVTSKGSNSTPVNCSVNVGSFEKTRSKEQSLESKYHHPEPLGPSSLSSTHIEESEEKTGPNSIENNDKSSLGMGFFNQIVNWCRSWKTSTNPASASGQCGEEVSKINNQSVNHELFSKEPDCASGQCGEEMGQINNQSGNQELFSKASFWDAVESFIHTPKGSTIVSQSRTREQMARQLQKGGPLVLNTLSASDLLHFVDLLISEKKWVDECLSQTSPFKLVDPARIWSSPFNPQYSNGLSAIFSGMSSQSNLQRPADRKTGNEDQNHAQTGVGSAEISKKPYDKSRSEILADCQKLVDEILVESPQGINIGALKTVFQQRYGYDLDYKNLGYQKLAALLQIMRGVKIDGGFIKPTAKVEPNSQWESDLPSSHENNGIGKESSLGSKISDSTRKDNGCCSLWEELGPISEIDSNRNNTESELNGKMNEEVVEHVDFDGDSYLSDEECSDSEGKFPIRDGSEEQGKFRRNEEDSSLLQILDSWYGRKNDTASKNKLHDDANGLVDCSQNDSKSPGSPGVGAGRTCKNQLHDDANGLVDCSQNDSKSSGSSGVGADRTHIVSNYERKAKHRKNYSFVDDIEGGSKDKLLDGILGTLKKSGESRVQS